MSDEGADWDRWLKTAWQALSAEQLDRSLVAIEPVGATRVRIDDREVCLFSGNDYMVLSTHPEVRRAAIDAIEQFGLGPRGSPLTCGYTTAHERLEATLADLEGAERALLFPTGYAANLGVISSVSDDDTEIFSDSLNHASIIDGIRLCKARKWRYKHRDLADLEAKLKEAKGD